MNDFEQQFSEVRRAAERTAELAVAVWALGIVIAIVTAFWIFRDAEARGKVGFFAALMVVVSATLDFRVTLLVLCAWVLLRPDKIRRMVTVPNRELPTELPSGMVAGPTPSEFLNDLERRRNASAERDV